MLEFLFSSELYFSQSWDSEIQLGNLMEEVGRLSQKIRALLRAEHANIWEEYQAKVRQLRNLDCKMEFERGFLIAAELFSEISGRFSKEPGSINKK